MEFNNITDLGTEYNLVSKSGEIMKTVRVLHHSEIEIPGFDNIIDLFFGDEVDRSYEYYKALIKSDSGIDTSDISWYRMESHNSEVDICQVIDLAVDTGASIIIIEDLA